MNIQQELATMERMSTGQLAERYAELFGQPVRTRHRAYLIRKVAWRLQANAEGDLSERARRRAMELADDADVRLMPPRADTTEARQLGPATGQVSDDRDPRLPTPGTAITRRYKGRKIEVVVLARGFEYEGRPYKTLTAVAGAITGTHCNGFRFFRLGGVL
jgi:hypothetical protein